MITGVVNKFNRGVIDVLALARDDVKKVINSASQMTNFWPVRLGPMRYRPGTNYLGTTNAGGIARFEPFVAAADDMALLEFTDQNLRIWVDDEVVTRTSVTTTITNETFDTDLTGWTDSSGVGSSTAWVTGGYASLVGAGSTTAKLYQTLTTQTGVEHGLKIGIVRAPVHLEIGTSGSNSNDIFAGTLKPGVHHLAFTPSGTVTITISNSTKYAAFVDSIEIAGNEQVIIPTSLTEANLDTLRITQSADVVFCAALGVQQFVIERRGIKSWSVVDYRVDDGPFETINTDRTVSMLPSGLSGDISIFALNDYFTAGHIGSLIKIASSGQTVEADVTAGDSGTGSIRVTGVGASRAFTVNVTGTFVATVTLQRSYDDLTWTDVETYTTVTTKSYNDTADNSIFYYRLWVKTGDYTSGTASLSLDYASGSIEGVARITGYLSGLIAYAQVLVEFGATESSYDWYIGSWSDINGYPSSVVLQEGRLWWAGKNKLWGSVSDAYYVFDPDTVGDSGPIQKTIGFGPVDDVHWLAPGIQLLMGLASNEISVRSSSFGEPLTPTNCNLKSGSNQGASNVAPVIVDDRIFFVQRSGVKVFQLLFEVGKDLFVPDDINVLNNDVCNPGIKRIFSGRQPETRIYAVLNDGTIGIYTNDPSEDMAAWHKVTTTGTIEDVVVLPGDNEDAIYIVVNRTNGRYLERFAMTSEAVGASQSKHFDCATYLTSPGTSITGLIHLASQNVGIWADGQDRGTQLVSASGTMTLTDSWTNVVIGLRYDADYISNKLSNYVQFSVLSQLKRVFNTALIMKDYYPGLIKVGSDSTVLYPLPSIENGKAVGTTTISTMDEIPFDFDSDTDVDPRIHIKATGPCTILALTYGIEYAENTTGQS